MQEEQEKDSVGDTSNIQEAAGMSTDLLDTREA
jgi:hypothetical protein